MDDAVYREFDLRAHQFFLRLMAQVDRTNPDRTTLGRIFQSEVSSELELSRREYTRLERGFNFTYRGHRLTPLRESGESYIFHLVRAALVITWVEVACGVRDIDLIILTLLHDCIEESRLRLMGGHTRYARLLTHSRIRLRFGQRMADDVFELSKHKEMGEDSPSYCARLTRHTSWRPLTVKIGADRVDNMWTIGSVSPERRVRKIAETTTWFPGMCAQLTTLIHAEVGAGRLSPADAWLRFTTFITGYLWYAVEAKKREFNIA